MEGRKGRRGGTVVGEGAIRRDSGPTPPVAAEVRERLRCHRIAVVPPIVPQEVERDWRRGAEQHPDTRRRTRERGALNCTWPITPKWAASQVPLLQRYEPPRAATWEGRLRGYLPGYRSGTKGEGEGGKEKGSSPTIGTIHPSRIDFSPFADHLRIPLHSNFAPSRAWIVGCILTSIAFLLAMQSPGGVRTRGLVGGRCLVPRLSLWWFLGVGSCSPICTGKLGASSLSLHLHGASSPMQAKQPVVWFVGTGVRDELVGERESDFSRGQVV